MASVQIQHRQLCQDFDANLTKYNVLVMTSQSYTVHSKPHPKVYSTLPSTVF